MRLVSKSFITAMGCAAMMLSSSAYTAQKQDDCAVAEQKADPTFKPRVAPQRYRSKSSRSWYPSDWGYYPPRRYWPGRSWNKSWGGDDFDFSFGDMTDDFNFGFGDGPDWRSLPWGHRGYKPRRRYSRPYYRGEEPPRYRKRYRRPPPPPPQAPAPQN